MRSTDLPRLRPAARVSELDHATVPSLVVEPGDHVATAVPKVTADTNSGRTGPLVPPAVQSRNGNLQQASKLLARQEVKDVTRREIPRHCAPRMSMIRSIFRPLSFCRDRFLHPRLGSCTTQACPCDAPWSADAWAAFSSLFANAAVALRRRAASGLRRSNDSRRRALSSLRRTDRLRDDFFHDQE